MATAIKERVAKTQYILMPDGNVIGWSKKAASTLIHATVKGPTSRRCGIAEAVAAKNLGHDVMIVVRHPLDRLVSNYVFWRTVNASVVRRIFLKDAGPAYDEQPVELPDDLDAMTIEEWYEFTQLKYNPHWEDQSRLHSDGGKLVPTVLIPWEALDTLNSPRSNPSPRDGTWEDYFTPEFKEKMEERYIDDLAMYIIATETWDGNRPEYL
jgi:hypothetical protein